MSASTSISATGQFQIINGQIYDPFGTPFTARGIAVDPSYMGSADQILADFPGLNFVRLTVTNYASPPAYAAFVNTMTSHGVVVEFEDHTSSDGSDQGGSRGVAFSGQELTNELNWYGSIATAYANNPYVWFGTDNEPPNDGLTEWQLATYNAIRSTGNASPIMLELPGGAYPGEQTATSYGLDPNVYATMYNTVVDVHLYGWSSNYVPDQGTVNAAMADLVDGARTVPTANGQIPVIIGEYGISTDGTDLDANDVQVGTAAQSLTGVEGAVAFTWAGPGLDTLTDGQGNLTPYGQFVANWIASGAKPPAVSSVPASSGASSDTVGQAEVSTYAAGESPTYFLPPAGDGVATLPGDTFSSGATVDLANALAATDWNGDASTLPSYVSVTDGPSGAAIWIAPTAGGSAAMIAVVPGSDQLDLSTVLAHAVT